MSEPIVMKLGSGNNFSILNCTITCAVLVPKKKLQFTLLFHLVHYAYILKVSPLIASGTQIVMKGKCASNTSDNSLSGVIFLIYNKFCTLLHIADLVCKGWAIKLAPAPRPSTIYCAILQIFHYCIRELLHALHRQHLFLVTPLEHVRYLLQALPSNGCCLQSHYLAMGLHATVYYDTGKKFHYIPGKEQVCSLVIFFITT
jgi:hypothetical protein